MRPWISRISERFVKAKRTMRTILPQRLWIGASGDVKSRRDFLNAEGRAVLQLAIEEPVAELPRDVMIGRFPLIDGTGNDLIVLEAAILMLRFLIERETPTLVTCSAGMSRSPCIVAAAIALSQSRSFNDCLAEVTASGPSDVSPALLSEVSAAVDAIRQRLADSR